jgi:glycosyltransferase involved in cell wall biosynthesis
MMLSPSNPRLLVFVIAYHAEKSLVSVLERIPASVFQDYRCEILVVDDASTDNTFQIGKAWKAAHPNIPITVLRNEYNQGYGGNQKVGYAYAISERFDFVAMVHGDGQYAPEELPRLVEPLANDQADAVFGSRMMVPGAARKGGMPLYKYVGNRILSRLQNALLGAKLSEFHSGYRVYRVSALQQVAFQLNSNEFHFDSEIIVQFLNARLRILELPIPTYYGDEICRVNGMKYAKDVMRVTLQNVAHNLGILYQRRFDTNPEDNRHYSLKLDFPSSHRYAIDAVPPGARVLDIGAGPGGIAKELLAKGCEVAVVDQHPVEEDVQAVKVIVQDLDQPVTFDVSPYSHLLLLDVIEHLHRPERFLEDLRTGFTHAPKTVIITTPNIAFLPERLMLALGQFNYGKAGILDVTHTRLFTFRSLLRLLRDSGFRIKSVRGIPAPFPKAVGDGVIGRQALKANLWLIRLSRSLFSYQIYIEAETTPNAAFVLRNARRRALEDNGGALNGGAAPNGSTTESGSDSAQGAGSRTPPVARA